MLLNSHADAADGCAMGCMDLLLHGLSTINFEAALQGRERELTLAPKCLLE
jgi:hypothetical protein